MEKPLSAKELAAIDAWWRAANYLSVGQIYLLENAIDNSVTLASTAILDRLAEESPIHGLL